MVPLEYEGAPRRGERDEGGYSVARASMILTAECVGTGVLALPGCAHTLGLIPFFALLGFQVGLNGYAGMLLAQAAQICERRASYNLCAETTTPLHDDVDEASAWGGADEAEAALDAVVFGAEAAPVAVERPRDFLDLAHKLDAGPRTTRIVGFCWYGNLFLIAAQYLVVMARALRAAVPIEGCAVLASLLASCAAVLVLSRLPTLDAIGRGAAQISFLAVVLILGACVRETANTLPNAWPAVALDGGGLAALAAAAGSVTFSMTSTKLLLNVRLEMAQPEEARSALGGGLAAYTTLYALVALLAGRDPPRFLLDALPRGSSRARAAAVLLFAHVAVSYSINQQVLARTLERRFGGGRRFALSVALTAASLLLALALPIFADLVSLIGSLTTGPLTFAIPALCYAAATRDAPRRRVGVAFLVALTIVLTASGTAGAGAEIVGHWRTQTRAAPGVRGFLCDAQAAAGS